MFVINYNKLQIINTTNEMYNPYMLQHSGSEIFRSDISHKTCFMIYNLFILLCAFVCQYIEHRKRHGVSNIKFVNVQKKTGLKL